MIIAQPEKNAKAKAQEKFKFQRKKWTFVRN